MKQVPTPVLRWCAAGMTAIACYDIPNFVVEGYDVVLQTSPESPRIVRPSTNGRICS